MSAQCNLDQLCINTIRMLAVDAIEKANSGHPGLPLGTAPIAYVLWNKFLRHNAQNPHWFNRDRFVLSAGHGSALLYALLHLSGYQLSLAQIQQFRQWQSKTPGHPEYGLTAGVEATTGPLGQGFAMGVGMAMAEHFLAARFNKPDFSVIDHYTYALVSDGDLMEGVASEAASLAGHLGLSKLIYLYDDNKISIEGSTDLAFSEDVAQRFRSYNWQVFNVADGNDPREIATAIQQAQAQSERPSLIIVATHIGYGSPKQDMAAAHGEPLGSEALQQTKQKLQWPLSPPFFIPEEVAAHFADQQKRGQESESRWQQALEEYCRQYPQLGEELLRLQQNQLPANWDTNVVNFDPAQGEIATRAASGKVLNSIATNVPQLIGGSADLAPSNKTMLQGGGDFSRLANAARNIHFGVREHAMGAIVNGMALHGGIIPYAGTFLVFSDYMRPALRLAAMMHLHAIFVFTHDSIALGEDGPTHQPIEHLMSLRTIPGFMTMRPADAVETVAAWKIALQHQGPVALVLTRQKLPILDTGICDINQGVSRGAYILGSESATPQAILLASGSEVHLALAAQKQLQEQGRSIRVVSMPCWELFDSQPPEYRQQVIPAAIPKLAIEAGSTLGWYKYVGSGDVLGLDSFGASAPWKIAYQKLGFHVENVVRKVEKLLQSSSPRES